jgi:hypothetical protein
MSDENVAAPAPAAPTEPPAIDPAPNDDVSLSREAFNARLQQAGRSAVKAMLGEVGFDDADAFKNFVETSKAAQAAEAERARKELSEIERAKKDIEAMNAILEGEKQRAAAAEAAAEAARLETAQARLFAEKGIKNHDYAALKLSKAKAALEDGADPIDEAKFLEDLAQDATEKAALGMGLPPTQEAPTTAHSKDGPDPKPAQKDGVFNAMTATPEQLARRMAELGL